MDTYRTNATPESMQREGQKALGEIAEFKPDIVFVLDDAATRQVMMPLVGHPDISLVFWHERPARNVRRLEKIHG
jgi:hypothetical protein